MTQSFIFPGQGSQYNGMGTDLAESFVEARDVFEEIDESLSQSLSKIMFGDDETALNLTENTQPALMAISMAVIRILEKQGGINIADTCSFVAGHSLGEYSALTAAGALNISDTAKLLKLRGTSMQKAVPVGEGSMAAILGLELDDVHAIAKEANKTALCEVANDNSNGQVVLSGSVAGIEAAVALATDKGAKRAVILPVSAPFHCSLMAPAADVMAEALANANINVPVVPVIANVTASAITQPDDIRRLLVEQITGMVRWRESILWMGENGIDSMVEIGAGKVLSGLTRRINRDITCQSVGTPEQIEALITQLKG